MTTAADTSHAYANIRNTFARAKRLGLRCVAYLEVEDLAVVLAEVRDECPHHTTCIHCEAELCGYHHVGETVHCGSVADVVWHCADCISRCGDCRAEWP